MSFQVQDGNSLLEVLGGDRKTLWHLFALAEALLMCSQDAADYYCRLSEVGDERVFIFAGRALYAGQQLRFGPVSFIEQFMPFDALMTKWSQYTNTIAPETTVYDALKTLFSESDDVTRRMMLVMMGLNAAVQESGAA